MNKTLLLILCDFLLLNLLALTRWEKAEPASAKQPPVPEMAANAATKDRDLVETMKQSLEDERATREQLAQKLSATESNLSTREQNLAKLEAERAKLSTSLTETQKTAEELNTKVAQATQDATMTREELARLQKELEERRAEAERQKQSLANYEKAQTEARQKIEVIIAGLAALRRTEDDVIDLARILGRMEREARESDDAAAFVDADVEFHLRLAETARNSALRDVLSSIQALLRAWIGRVTAEGNRDVSYAEHVPVLDAVRARDAEAAERAMEAHMHSAAQRLQATLDRASRDGGLMGSRISTGSVS